MLLDAMSINYCRDRTNGVLYAANERNIVESSVKRYFPSCNENTSVALVPSWPGS
jgi:hypothetical protein